VFLRWKNLSPSFSFLLSPQPFGLPLVRCRLGSSAVPPHQHLSRSITQVHSCNQLLSWLHGCTCAFTFPTLIFLNALTVNWRHNLKLEDFALISILSNLQLKQELTLWHMFINVL
jgi:hypothetical protein